MLEKCELNVVKYVLFIFNFIFAISGIGLIIAGALVLTDVADYRHFMEGKIVAPPIVLIVAGAIVFFIAFLGCYGAIRESYYMLMAFAVCLLIIFIIELSVGIAAAVYKSDLQMILKTNMDGSLNRYQTSNADRLAWDNLQSNLMCCGVEGPVDWPPKQRPYSCCHEVREGVAPPENFHCQDAQPKDDILYSTGCLEKLQMKADDNMKVLIGVGIGIAFVEVIGIVLACWLASAVKRKE